MLHLHVVDTSFAFRVVLNHFVFPILGEGQKLTIIVPLQILFILMMPHFHLVYSQLFVLFLQFIGAHSALFSLNVLSSLLQQEHSSKGLFEVSFYLVSGAIVFDGAHGDVQILQ
jgi:cellulose synthase/poly-beta-1,6-N-acetylglucosamine synthase-like glycosyltransferase